SLTNERDTKTRRGFLKDALGSVAFSQHDLDRARGGDVRNNTRAQRAREFVQALEISWIRHRDVQTFLISLQRYELMPHHQVDWNLSEEFVVNRRFLVRWQQIDKRQPVATREFTRGLHFGRLMIIAV